MFPFVNYLSTFKSNVYYSHSSYYQLLFTNTIIHIFTIFPLYHYHLFFTLFSSSLFFTFTTHLPYLTLRFKTTLTESQQTPSKSSFRITGLPSSYPIMYEYSHPPPETRGCAKFSPIIRLNICLLTHTHTHTHNRYNYRIYRGPGSLLGLCRGNHWKIALFASYTLVDPHRCGNFDSFTLLANSSHQTVFQD